MKKKLILLLLILLLSSCRNESEYIKLENLYKYNYSRFEGATLDKVLYYIDNQQYKTKMIGNAGNIEGILLTFDKKFEIEIILDLSRYNDTSNILKFEELRQEEIVSISINKFTNNSYKQIIYYKFKGIYE
jgi:hypothetical protein